MEQIIQAVKEINNKGCIYPGELAEKQGIGMKETYLLLEEKKELLNVESCFQIVCNNCNKFGKVYETISNLPEIFQCETCHVQKYGFESSIVLYKIR